MNSQLLPLPETERLSASIVRILGGNPGKSTLQGTNTYLVGRGPRRLLIDTGDGKPSWIQLLKDTLTSEHATVDSVILTHWHPDHVGGVKDFLESSPGTRVYKNSPDDNQLDIKDGQRFRVEGVTLRALHSPGHTADHMAFIFEEEDAMFTGDNVLGHGTVVFEDLANYLLSLEKMRHQFTRRAYPGHGPVIEDGAARILEYIEHRAQRESQVMQVLKSARDSWDIEQANESRDSVGWTSMEIVKVIYKDVPEELHSPAERGVLQVLWKLQEEDKAFRDSASNRWMFSDRAAT